MKLCEWCDNTFKATVSYQIYCSINCRDEATKEKIIVRHKVLKRKNRKNKTRICSGGCGTPLSVYNDDPLCSSCDVNNKQVNKKLKEIKSIIKEIDVN